MKKIVNTIDATNQSLGRLATQIAVFLMGKHRTDFVPNQDKGEAVLIKNAAKVKMTGKKAEQKKYQHHTTHPGGLKTDLFADVFKKDPAEVIYKAVSRMLPKNKLRNERLKRLKIEV